MAKKSTLIKHMRHPGKDKVVRLTKKIIRSKILARLKTQEEEDRNRKSKIIQKKLLRTLAFHRARTIMFFNSFSGEVDTKEMIEHVHSLGKTIAVPVSCGGRLMKPALLRRGMRLVRGMYGTREPATRRFISLRNIDLVIVPGVAFDKKGNRLGRGKGCYDAFLHKLPKTAISIGLAFDFQILPFVPSTPRDKRVDKVLFA